MEDGVVSYGRFLWDVLARDVEALQMQFRWLLSIFALYLTFDGLAVLHNRTNVSWVTRFTVKNSNGETRTHCVTSCAGSTAFLSVLAQTRRYF